MGGEWKNAQTEGERLPEEPEEKGGASPGTRKRGKGGQLKTRKTKKSGVAAHNGGREKAKGRGFGELCRIMVFQRGKENWVSVARRKKKGRGGKS